MRSTMTKIALFTISIAISQNALATCTGVSCEGKDPAVEGCGSDAIVVARTLINDSRAPTYNMATLELKWSKKCQANWGLLINNYGFFAEAYETLDSVSVVNTTTGVERKFASGGFFYAVSSPMTYGLGRCTYAKGQASFHSATYNQTWLATTATIC